MADSLCIVEWGCTLYGWDCVVLAGEGGGWNYHKLLPMSSSQTIQAWTTEAHTAQLVKHLLVVVSV